MLEAGQNEFVIPIVTGSPNGSYKQSMPVVGFATVAVDGLTVTGNDKGLNLTAISVTTTGVGEGGGGVFGTFLSRLAQ